MSRPRLNKDGKCESRNGEYYVVNSAYRLPNTPGLLRSPWAKLLGDIDELQNKPRRFFDTLLSIVETQRDNDPLINNGNRREYWDYLIEGCEMWLSAVEHGLYGSVVGLSVPLDRRRHENKR